MLNWGIIGAGSHVQQHIIPALRKTARGRVAGIVGSTPERGRAVAERLGLPKAYPSIEAMLEDPTVQAVFIATPNYLHAPQTCLAAAAGKHVLVEKPMALSVSECQEMIAACRAAGVKLGVGFHARHHPVHQELRRLISTGELGQVVLLRGEWHSSYGVWSGWRGDPEQAGADVLVNVGVHVLDLLGYLAGSEVVDVAAHVVRSAESGLDETIACSMTFASGAMATATMTRRSAWPLNSVHVWGTEGSAGGVGTLGMQPRGTLRRTRGTDVQDSEFPVPDLYAEQFDAFAEAVATDRDPNASGEDGLRSVALCEQLLQSSRV